MIHLGNVKRKNIGFDIVTKEKRDYPEKLGVVKTALVLERLRKYAAEGEKIKEAWKGEALNQNQLRLILEYADD